jgi:putative salt-induced outer membrane protein YdiY
MKTSVIAALCICAVAWTAGADEEQKNGVKTTLSLGATFTDGNSETMQANASLVTEGEKEGLGSLRAGLEGNYGESTVDGKDETTVENARAFANARKTLSARTFASLNADALYDDIARVDYRAALGPGLGVYLLKNEKTSLTVEAGPSYVWEEVADVSDDYLALRFAERCEHALSDTARVWQSLEFMPTSDDFDDYLLNAEIGVEAALNTHMNLRLVLQNKYDSTPGPALEKSDTALVAGLSVSL